MKKKSSEDEFAKVLSDFNALGRTITRPDVMQLVANKEPCAVRAVAWYNEALAILTIAMFSDMDDGGQIVFDTDKAAEAMCAESAASDKPEWFDPYCQRIITRAVQTHVDTGLLEPIGGTRFLVHKDIGKMAVNQAIEENLQTLIMKLSIKGEQ